MRNTQIIVYIIKYLVLRVEWFYNTLQMRYENLSMFWVKPLKSSDISKTENV